MLPRAEMLLISKAAAWSGAGVLFLGISRFHQWITPLAKLQAPTLLSVAALGLLFTSLQTWKPADLMRHWLTKGVIALVCIAVIGIPFSIYPGRAFSFFNESYSRTFMLWMAGWAIARSAGGARFLAKTLAASGIMAAFMAVLMNRHDSAGRLSGAFTYDPNDIALVSVMTLPLVYWWLVEKRNGPTRWLVLPSVPMLLYVVIESGSRSAFLGMAASILGMLFLMGSRTPKPARTFAKWAVFACIAAVPLLPSDYIERVNSITSEDDYNRDSPTGRIEVWKRGLGYGLGHPLLGVGIGNFETAEGWSDIAQARQAMGSGFKWSTAHNSFVQVFAEMGIPAGILFPLLLIFTAKSLIGWNGRKAPGEPDDPLPAFLGIAFIGFIVDGMFLSFAYYDIVYAYIALAAGVLNPIRASARALNAPSAPITINPRGRVPMRPAPDRLVVARRAPTPGV